MKKNIIRIGVFLLGIVFVSVAVYVAENVFRVKYIRVIGSDVLIEIDERLFPRSMIFFPKDWFAKEIVRQYPQLSSVQIHKIYPDTLELIFTRRPPVAIVEIGSAQRFVDELGFPATDIDLSKKYPRISITAQDQKFPVSSALFSSALKAAARITCIEIILITKNDERSIRLKTQESDILVAQDADFHSIDRTLQSLIGGFRMKGLQPKVIDLRFNKPVITN